MGVWIETLVSLCVLAVSRSHPVWVCGLKHTPINVWDDGNKSHPVWVCGLKQAKNRAKEHLKRVTPCMGVWIETAADNEVVNLQQKSHPVWVCGLKLVSKRTCSNTRSHTLYGCVD